MYADEEELVEAIVEGLTEDEADDYEWCPCCETAHFVRMILRYPKAVGWIVFCEDCGRFFQKRWTLLN